MRAAVLEEAGKPLVVRDDIDIAAPRAGQVRVRVTHCGVCHSDLSLADGVFPCPTPIILGHEAAGVVDAVGPDVEGLAAGRSWPSRNRTANAASRRVGEP